MAKRRAKKNIRQPASSPPSNLLDADSKEPPISNKENTSPDQEVEGQITGIRTLRDVETERLLTGLCLLKSNFTEEQLRTPVLQFFEENLPNLVIAKNGKDEQYEVQWKCKYGNLSMNTAGGNIHTSLLHRMSMGYPECFTALQSLGGFEFSSKAVKASLLGVDNLQNGNFVLEEQYDTLMHGLHDSLQTPGATSQRLSVGMTPKTLRVPKHGEMLLSVHGSPLGVYKEDNMEAINETEEE